MSARDASKLGVPRLFLTEKALGCAQAGLKVLFLEIRRNNITTANLQNPQVLSENLREHTRVLIPTV